MRIHKLRKQGNGNFKEMSVITINETRSKQHDLVYQLTGIIDNKMTRPVWKALNDEVAVRIEY